MLSTASEAKLPLPSSRVPSSLRTGTSYLTLVPSAANTLQFAVNRSKAPLVIYDDEISIGESYSWGWDYVPTVTRTSEPNERRFSLTVPSDVGKRNVQIDLTSGDRDAVLVLKDDNGNVVEWNDDGSGWTDLGAKTTSLTKDVSFTTRPSSAPPTPAARGRRCRRSRAR